MKEITQKEFLTTLESFGAHPGLISTLTDQPYEVCWSVCSLAKPSNLFQLLAMNGSISTELKRALFVMHPAGQMRYYIPKEGIVRADIIGTNPTDIGYPSSRLEINLKKPTPTFSFFKKGLNRPDPVPTRIIDAHGAVLQQAFLGYSQRYMAQSPELSNIDILEIGNEVTLIDDVIVSKTQTEHHGKAIYNTVYTEGRSLTEVRDARCQASWGFKDGTVEKIQHYVALNNGYLRRNTWTWRDDILLSKQTAESNRSILYASFYDKYGKQALYAEAKKVEGKDVDARYQVTVDYESRDGMDVSYSRVDCRGNVVETYVGYHTSAIQTKPGCLIQRNVPPGSFAKINELGSKMTGEPIGTKVYYIHTGKHSIDNKWLYQGACATTANPNGLIAVYIGTPAPDKITANDYNNIVFLSSSMMSDFTS